MIIAFPTLSPFLTFVACFLFASGGSIVDLANSINVTLNKAKFAQLCKTKRIHYPVNVNSGKSGNFLF